MRINQFLSHNTKFSRREADELIKSGRVKIGRKIALLSDKVAESDKVFIDSHEIKTQNQYTLIAYHKPKGELVSKSDTRERRVIYESLDAKFRHFVPVGRLDFASSGILILSDSVKIATALAQSKLTRIYNIKVDGKITANILDAAQNGLSVADARAGGHKHSKIMAMDFAPFEFFEILRESKSGTKIKVGINEGQNRELRRFFAHFGLSVLDLCRVSFGFVSLNALPSGKWRYFDKKEYKKLREFLAQNLVESAHFPCHSERSEESKKKSNRDSSRCRAQNDNVGRDSLRCRAQNDNVGRDSSRCRAQNDNVGRDSLRCRAQNDKHIDSAKHKSKFGGNNAKRQNASRNTRK